MTKQRLQWRRSVRPCSYIAYPHGDGEPAYASVEFHGEYPQDTPQWLWIVQWRDRFRKSGRTFAKQEAADAATDAYWSAMEETADWRPPEPSKVDTEWVNHMEVLRQQTEGMSKEELREMVGMYREAVINGPSISGRSDIDREAWSFVSSRFSQSNAGSF